MQSARSLFTVFSSPLHLLRRLAIVGILLSLFLLGRHIWEQRLLPATGTDSLIYHLTLPAYWLQHGYLASLDLPFQPGTAEQPMFAETIAYILLYLSKSDTWAWLIQPAFFLHLLWLFFASARRLGAPPSLTMALTAHLALFTPFTRNIAIFNNDVILAWAAAIFGLGVCNLQRQQRKGWLLASAGLGLMMAVKMVGILYAAAGLIVALAAHFISGRAKRVATTGFTAIAAVLLLASGGVFLLRNLLIYGNPFYPQEVRLGDYHIFAGLYDLSHVAGQSPYWRDLGALFFSGQDFAASIIDGPLFAAGLITVAIALYRGSTTLRWRCFFSALWPLASAALYFALFPNWPDPRFLFPLYYSLWLTVAQAAAILCLSNRCLTLAVILGWLALRLEMVMPAGCWVWTVPALALAMMLTACSLRRLLPLCVGIALGAIFIAAPWWHDSYLRQRALVRHRAWEALYGNYGRAWRCLWEMSCSQPLTIAYAGTSWLFPLFGPRLDNQVVYVPLSPLDKPQPVALQPGEWPLQPLLRKRRKSVDEEFWLQNLRRQNVDVLLVCDNPSYGGAKQEIAIIERHPKDFRLVFVAGEVSIYKYQSAR